MDHVTKTLRALKYLSKHGDWNNSLHGKHLIETNMDLYNE